MAFQLELTDGTTTLDFLDKTSGYLLMDGGLDIPAPRRIEATTGDTIAAFGSRLLDYSYTNREITIQLALYGADYDTVISKIEAINTMLDKSMRYWTRDAGCEVELKYKWDGATNITYFGVISGEFNLPSDIMSLEKLLWYNSADSTYELHDCTLKLVCEPFGYGDTSLVYNMVPNASFEWDQDDDGEPDYWTIPKSTTTGTLDTSTVKFGHNSLQVVTDATSGDYLESNTISVSASTSYRASAWVKVSAGTVNFRAVGNVSGTITSSGAVSYTSWTKLTLSFTTGASDSTVYLDFEMPASTIVWVDGVHMMKASDITGSGTPDVWCDYTEKIYNTMSIGTGDSVDSEQGTLAYQSGGFQDTGQNFGDWSTPASRAKYKLTVTNTDSTVTWAYMKDAYTTTNLNDSIYVYQDISLTTSGWNGAGIAGKTPSTYVVEPIIVRHNSFGVASSGFDAPSPVKLLIQNTHSSHLRNGSHAGIRQGKPPWAQFSSSGAWAGLTHPMVALEIENADYQPGTLSSGSDSDSGEGTSKISSVTLSGGATAYAYWTITPDSSLTIDSIKGQYRQILRAKFVSGTASDLKMYGEINYLGLYAMYTTSKVNGTTAGYYVYYDLGEVELPAWEQRTGLPDDIRYYLRMENSGTASITFEVDCVYLLPSDRYKYLKHIGASALSGSGSATYYDNIDHDDMVFYSGELLPSSSTTLIGGKFSESLGDPIYLYPDEQIVFYILNFTGSEVSYADATIKCRLWYRPSYLHVRGS